MVGPNPYGPNPYAQPYPPFLPPGPAGPRNGFGITALICGVVGALLGFVVYLFVLTAILGVIALVFGVLGVARARRGEATNRSVAMAGTALGVIALAASVVGVIIVVNDVEDFGGDFGSYLECVGHVDQNDPQRDAKLRDCSSRFD